MFFFERILNYRAKRKVDAINIYFNSQILLQWSFDY